MDCEEAPARSCQSSVCKSLSSRSRDLPTEFQGGEMKSKTLLTVAILVLLGLGSSKAFASDPSLQDLWFNVNGIQTELTAPIAGYNSSTGLGTITYTTSTPGAGYFNAWFDESVSTPFYNEYGTANGTPGSVSWEIGDSYASTIFADAKVGTLNNSNMLPEGASNYLVDSF